MQRYILRFCFICYTFTFLYIIFYIFVSLHFIFLFFGYALSTHIFWEKIDHMDLFNFQPHPELTRAIDRERVLELEELRHRRVETPGARRHVIRTCSSGASPFTLRPRPTKNAKHAARSWCAFVHTPADSGCNNAICTRARRFTPDNVL